MAGHHRFRFDTLNQGGRLRSIAWRTNGTAASIEMNVECVLQYTLSRRNSQYLTLINCHVFFLLSLPIMTLGGGAGQLMDVATKNILWKVLISRLYCPQDLGLHFLVCSSCMVFLEFVVGFGPMPAWILPCGLVLLNWGKLLVMLKCGLISI